MLKYQITSFPTCNFLSQEKRSAISFFEISKAIKIHKLVKVLECYHNIASFFSCAGIFQLCEYLSHSICSTVNSRQRENRYLVTDLQKLTCREVWSYPVFYHICNKGCVYFVSDLF